MVSRTLLAQAGPLCSGEPGGRWPGGLVAAPSPRFPPGAPQLYEGSTSLSPAVLSDGRWVSPHSKKPQATRRITAASQNSSPSFVGSDPGVPSSARAPVTTLWDSFKPFTAPFAPHQLRKGKPGHSLPRSCLPQLSEPLPFTHCSSRKGPSSLTFVLAGPSTWSALPHLRLVQAYCLLDTVQSVFQIHQQPCNIGVGGESRKPGGAQPASGRSEF